MLRVILLIGSMLVSGAVWAFGQEKIVFSNPSNPAAAVEFVFTGAKLDPALDLLNKGVVKNAEIRPIQEFFQTMYKVNLEGSRDDILSIWNAEERAGVKAEMTDELFNANRERFKAIETMQLKMVVEYGAFYIAFVALDFGSGNTTVMKFPITRLKGKLYLTNRLNGDYFYDAISHYLDPTNFKSM